MSDTQDAIDRFREHVAPRVDPMMCMPFGRYRGLTIKKILEEDRQYLQWLNSRHVRNVHVRFTIRALLEKP